MKKNLIIIGLVFLNLTLFGQNDYIAYYQLCNKAKSLFKENKIDSASILFQQAFSKVDYVHNSNLKTASKVEKKKGNSEKAKEYLDIIDRHENSINRNLKRQIDSLGNKDQQIRTNKYMKARDYYYKCKFDTTFKFNQNKLSKATSIMFDWWRTDSLNILELNKLIKKYGFPGERLVGENSYLSAMVIILHFDRDTCNHIMIDILNNALKNGDLLPRDYAWIIDRHLNNAGKKQLYYTIAFDMQELKSAEKEEYNKNRVSIGLDRLQEMIIIKRGNNLIIKNK